MYNSRERNGNWKGGLTRTSMGYLKRLAKWHPHCDRDGYVMEHRLVMESEIKRLLVPHEVVHHKDKDKQNNHPDNLEVLTQAEHLQKHRRGRFLACHTCGKRVYRHPGHKSDRAFCSQACNRLPEGAHQKRWERDAL